MLILIDGSNLLHRALGTPLWELRSSSGVCTGGVFGFLRSLHKICRRTRYAWLPIVAWDEGIVKFRQKIYPEYKCWKTLENRDQVPARDSEIEKRLQAYHWSKIFLHESFLPLVGGPSVMVPGVEADDIIAFLTKNSNMSSIIVSNDNDLMQLISENVVVYQPRQDKIYNKDEFLSSYNLNSSHYREEFIFRKALAGDSADGIPGIHGVGPVRAKAIATAHFSGDKENDQYRKYYLPNIHLVDRNISLIDLMHFQRLATEEVRQIRNRVVHSLAMYSGDYYQALSLLESLELDALKPLVLDITEAVNQEGVRTSLIQKLTEVASHDTRTS